MNKYFILIIAFFTATSCGEDFFSTTLEVDPPEHVPQMVLHTFITASDTIMSASVGRSKGILEDFLNEDLYLNDAKVSFYEGNNLMFELLPEALEGYNYYGRPDEMFVEEGKTYTIKASHPSYGEITATQTVPKTVEISSGQIKENAGVNEYGERTSQVEINFEDPAGEANFYEVVILAIDVSTPGISYYPIYATSLDPNTTEGIGGSIILNDPSFDGKEYKLLLDIDNYYLENGSTLFAIWRTTTEDYYLYSKSLSIDQQGSGFEFFSEPVSIHSNVTNGLGVFGMITETFFEF